MEVYLIRHTRTNAPKSLIYGHLDVGLGENFEQDAQEIIQKLPQNPQRVYSSPLKRCLLLAEKITSHQIYEDERLKELHFGQWEGRHWHEIPEAELDPWMEDFVHQTPPGGESLVQMQERIMEFWKTFTKLPNRENVVIVSHAGVIRIILAQHRGIPLSEIFQISVDFGEINKILL